MSLRRDRPLYNVVNLSREKRMSIKVIIIIVEFPRVSACTHVNLSRQSRGVEVRVQAGQHLAQALCGPAVGLHSHYLEVYGQSVPDTVKEIHYG